MSIKERWREFREGEPGRRFQEQYRRRHQEGGGGWRRWAFLGGGIVLLAAGLFFLPAPGPGTLVLLAGAGLIAQESRVAARALDWLELRVRAVLAWGRGVWRRASWPVRVVLALVALALAAAAAYGAYRLFFAR